MLAFRGFIYVLLVILVCISKTFGKDLPEESIVASESNSFSNGSSNGTKTDLHKGLPENTENLSKTKENLHTNVPIDIKSEDELGDGSNKETKKVEPSPKTIKESYVNSIKSTGPTTEVSVNSQAIQLTKNTTAKTESASLQLPESPKINKLANNDKNPSKLTVENYKRKIRPSYYSYIDDITNEEPETLNDEVMIPSRMRAEEYDIRYPYGSVLPTFSGKELDRLRLNHWRVNHILKGSVDVEAEKLGLPGTRKAILQAKYPHPVIGQKRAALVSSEPSYLDDSAADSLSSLLISADQDNSPVQQLSPETSSPSKIRTFFNWFSNKNYDMNDGNRDIDPRRLEQLKVQQAILPVALDYRGDFLFW